MKKIVLLLFSILISLLGFSQNDTSTPYSLFALGVENKTATGGLTGLGNTGIAQKNAYEINGYNPANLGNINQRTFLYEFGINGTYSELKTDDVSQNTYDANLSHLAFAFPVMKNVGLSVGILPYTKVGYDIDIENPIEGSEETFLSRISGQGGLNKFYLAGGIKLLKKLNLGIDLSYLFGSVDQQTQIYYESLVSITDKNHYKGFKVKAGLQYTLLKKDVKEMTLGAVIGLPTKLEGTQTRSAIKTSSLSGIETIIEEETENQLDNFELPLSYGFGLTTVLSKSFTTSFDFNKFLWDETNQYQNQERYVNQDIYAFGLEYVPANNYTYWDQVKYKLGINYNTGYLQISNKQIDSYFISLGVGLPLSKHKDNWLNMAYSYGQEGSVDSNLIQENFHKLTLNLNFSDNWFNKRKIR